MTTAYCCTEPTLVTAKLTSANKQYYDQKVNAKGKLREAEHKN